MYITTFKYNLNILSTDSPKQHYANCKSVSARLIQYLPMVHFGSPRRTNVAIAIKMRDAVRGRLPFLR